MNSALYEQPLVTIGIPAYQRISYLEEAVESARSQTWGNLEIIISQNPADNGRAQEVSSICRKLAATDPRISYRCNDSNRGLAGNWNELADAANGLYLTIMGDDDRLAPDFVERLMSAAGDSPDVLFSNHWIMDSHGERLDELTRQVTATYHRSTLPPGPVECPEKSAWLGVVPICSSLILTSRVREMRFREELNTPEVEFFIRLFRDGGRCAFVPEYLAGYRVHGESETARGLWMHKLAASLLPYSVSPEIEPYKRLLFGKIMIPAVNQALLAGDREGARKLLYSEYYGLGGAGMLKNSFHRLCCVLPFPLGTSLFTAGYRLFSGMKRRSHGT